MWVSEWFNFLFRYQVSDRDQVQLILLTKLIQ